MTDEQRQSSRNGRADFLELLDQLEAALEQPPKEGYDKRGVTICIEDQCEAGAETTTAWDIELADIAMLRSALSERGRDTERMDWLNQIAVGGQAFQYAPIRWALGFDTPDMESADFRAAVDAAMAEEAKSNEMKGG